MSIPINIEAMRSSFGYNCEVERKSLAEFVENAHRMLRVLRLEPEAMCNDSYNQTWLENIRYIKDFALKIGASRLAEMATRAEHQWEADAVVKEHLLDLVTREFSETQHFITSVIGHDAVSA